MGNLEPHEHLDPGKPTTVWMPVDIHRTYSGDPEPSIGQLVRDTVADELSKYWKRKRGEDEDSCYNPEHQSVECPECKCAAWHETGCSRLPKPDPKPRIEAGAVVISPGLSEGTVLAVAGDVALVAWHEPMGRPALPQAWQVCNLRLLTPATPMPGDTVRLNCGLVGVIATDWNVGDKHRYRVATASHPFHDYARDEFTIVFRSQP